MSALAEELEAVVRRVLREELPRVLAELREGVQLPIADDLLGVAAAARRLGLRPGTVYKLGARCDPPSHKSGGRVLFSPADLDAYVAARRRSPERVRDLAEQVQKP